VLFFAEHISNDEWGRGFCNSGVDSTLLSDLHRSALINEFSSVYVDMRMNVDVVICIVKMTFCELEFLIDFPSE
jgi:hypothetical protein